MKQQGTHLAALKDNSGIDLLVFYYADGMNTMACADDKPDRPRARWIARTLMPGDYDYHSKDQTNEKE